MRLVSITCFTLIMTSLCYAHARVHRCDQQVSCRVPVNDDQFEGDPCPGTFKYLDVTAACVPHPQDIGNTGNGRREMALARMRRLL